MSVIEKLNAEISSLQMTNQVCSNAPNKGSIYNCNHSWKHMHTQTQKQMRQDENDRLKEELRYFRPFEEKFQHLDRKYKSLKDQFEQKKKQYNDLIRENDKLEVCECFV